MRLVTFHQQDRKLKLGMVEADRIVPIRFRDSMPYFIALNKKTFLTNKPIPIESAVIVQPIINPSKIIAIGLNYKDHAAEINATIPDQPMVFAKFPNSLLGPYHLIALKSHITKKVDYEAELAIVISKTVTNCEESDAYDAIFGYTCANDISARDLQFTDGQWIRSKSLDTFCPLGPWIVTKDEIPDPNKLKIKCILNGKVMQNSNTKNMIFSVPKLVSYLSKHFILFPGDIILTGTPGGVGHFRKPPVYLADKDIVSVEIEKIGKLENSCVEVKS